MAVQPHVSAAVKHLRGWITFAAAIVVVCAITQMLVYGFVNYTDIRFNQVQKVTPFGERKLEVRVPTPEESPAPEAIPAVAGGVRAQAIERGREIAPERTLSNANRVMGHITDTTTSLGVFACLCLAAMTLLGAVVAGGGAIPGVEKTVTAAFWSVVLGLMCLPWSSAFPGLKIPGIFSTYHAMTLAADGVPGSIGPTAAAAQWLLMPLLAGVAALFVCGWYRAGVERGIIATSVSQFDRAIEQEMTTLAKQGVTARAPRTLGVLNAAIGGAHGKPHVISPSAAPMVPIAPARTAAAHPGSVLSVEQAVDEAAAMAAALAREAGASASGNHAVPARGVADAGFRRLI